MCILSDVHIHLKKPLHQASLSYFLILHKFFLYKIFTLSLTNSYIRSFNRCTMIVCSRMCMNVHACRLSLNQNEPIDDDDDENGHDAIEKMEIDDSVRRNNWPEFKFI